MCIRDRHYCVKWFKAIYNVNKCLLQQIHMKNQAIVGVFIAYTAIKNIAFKPMLAIQP